MLATSLTSPVPPVLLFPQAPQTSHVAASSALCLSPRCQARREADGLDQAGMIGDAAACDVERGAVIDRRTDDRQPERDVDGSTEREQLDRNQPLVVITGDDDVELAARGADEHGVAGPRPGDVDAASPCGFDRGTEDAFVFSADHAVLAGVRIEPGTRQARVLVPESWNLPRGEADDPIDEIP